MHGTDAGKFNFVEESLSEIVWITSLQRLHAAFCDSISMTPAKIRIPATEYIKVLLQNTAVSSAYFVWYSFMCNVLNAYTNKRSKYFDKRPHRLVEYTDRGHVGACPVMPIHAHPKLCPLASYMMIVAPQRHLANGKLRYVCNAIQWAGNPPKVPLVLGDPGPRLIHGYFGPPHHTFQTLSRSARPFLQGAIS